LALNPRANSTVNQPLDAIRSSMRKGRCGVPACAPMVLLVFLALTACGDGASDGEAKDDQAVDPPAPQPPRVVCGNAIIQHFVERVCAGTQVTVIDTLARRGESAGAYIARPLDTERIKTADIIFLNGLGLEAAVEPMIDRMKRDDATVIHLALAAKPEATAAITADNANARVDAASKTTATENANVRTIAGTLAARWPIDAGTFHANADRLLAELDVVNAWVLQQFEPLSASQRIVLTNEPALRVLGAAYGLDVRLIELDLSRYPTVADQQLLLDALKLHQPRAVYIDTGDAIWAELIADAATQHKARLIGELHLDTLSPAAGPAGNYEQMMRQDVTAIVEAVRR